MKTQEQIWLDIVKIDGMELQWVEEKTHAIVLAAVSQNGQALQFVDNQTPEIVNAAIHQNIFSIVHAKEISHDIACYAISISANIFRHFKEQTLEISLAAVSKDGLLLDLIRDKNPAICLAAVSQNPHALKFVENQTDEIVQLAVSKNGYAIEHAKNINFEFVTAAFISKGNDLLVFSVSRGLDDIVDQLMRLNISIDYKSKLYPFTAFEKAVNLEDVNRMFSLRDHGANIHLKKTGSQRNLLAEVIFKTKNKDVDKKIPVIAALLSMGVSPNEYDLEGKTALMLAQDKPEFLSVIKAFNLKKLVESTLKEIDAPHQPRKQHF
jgi:hypothetical protein